MNDGGPGTTAPTLRERHRQETHQAIIRAAFELAIERGVAAITVHDITRAAGVSQRTFFNHFRTKEEVLVPQLPSFPPDAEQAFVDAAEPDLLTSLETLLVSLLTEMARHLADAPFGLPQFLQLLAANPELLPHQLAGFAAFDRRLTDLISRRLGRPPGDLACAAQAAAVTSALRVALESPFTCGTPAPATAPDPALIRTAFTALRDLAGH